MTQSTTPDLATVIRAAIAVQLKGARVALPGQVIEYDASTQQATVQPLVQEGFLDETGVRQAERLPAIAGVPVVFPGSGGFRVTFPIAVGDTVLLVFSSSSIDRWLALGGEVDPEDDRRHHISDAIAIPGLRDFAHALGNAPTATMSIGQDGGPTIEISGSAVMVGGPTLTQPTIMGTSFRGAQATLDVLVAADATATAAAMTALAAIPLLSPAAVALGAAAAAATAAAAGVTAFESSAATFLSTIAQVK